MTRSSTKELITPFENPERVFCSKRRLFKTLGLVESSSPEFDLFFDIEGHYEEKETIEIMMETMEQYMSKTHGNYGSGVAKPKINDKTHFELKGQFLKKLHEYTFSGLEYEDAIEHIKKVLEIVDLFHIPEVWIKQKSQGNGQKLGKHEHGKRKSTKEAGISSQSKKVKALSQ
ncbi:hypothetical protein Tco_0356013 [Tanacetum coccineum]